MAAANEVDAEQQRLAHEFHRLRAELVAVREQLWPSGEGHAFEKTRRPGVAGPVLIPPPMPDAEAVRGRALRDAALGVLLRAGRPMSRVEIHRALHLRGLVLLAGDPEGPTRSPR